MKILTLSVEEQCDDGNYVHRRNALAQPAQSRRYGLIVSGLRCEETLEGNILQLKNDCKELEFCTDSYGRKDTYGAFINFFTPLAGVPPHCTSQLVIVHVLDVQVRDEIPRCEIPPAISPEIQAVTVGDAP